MELIRYVRVLRRRWLMIVICPVVAAIAAGIVSLQLPNTYEAQVVVLVRPAQPFASTDPTQAALSADQITSTYATWITQRPLLESVIADLGLTTTSDGLQHAIRVTIEPNTTILDVRVQDTNPTLARDEANRLVADFITLVKATQQGEAALPNSRSGDNLIVVSPAVVPDRPVGPNRALNVAIAFGAGLLLALGIAYLLDYLDQSIKSDDEITQRLGLIAIGHIPLVAAAKGRHAELVALDIQSRYSEAFKALRTSLMFSTIDQELKTVVITSPAPEEGKTRTAANLAIVLAEAGYKTLLIDADFRRPLLHKVFERTRNIGLSNLILQDVTEDEAITPVEDMPNLWLITSGPIPPNPSELLGSGRIRELLARLRGAFTYVIIDTPPVNAVTDAAILAAFANGTIVVVEQGRTTFPALHRAQRMLDRVGAHTIGVVMNKVRASGGSGVYEYGNYGPPPNEPANRAPNQRSESKPQITIRR